MDSEQKEESLGADTSQDSLEASPDIQESTPDATGTSEAPAGTPAQETAPAGDKPKSRRSLRSIFKVFNVYLLLFMLVIIIGVAIVVGAYLNGKQSAKPSTISPQALSQKTFEQLANSDSTVGTPNKVLNVQSSAIFAGKVLTRQDLEVAGNLRLGGTLALNDLTSAGTAQFGQAQINKNLSVLGNTNLQGSVTLAKSLQVNGGGTFNGPLSTPQLTTPNLQLNGDLVLTHHISAGGATPGQSNGNALGGGGTASLSGSDTAGSITINTGGSPAAGCLINVTFASKFGATPRVLLTPVGASAGGLSYYVNRSSTGFSVCVSSPAPASSTFGFDYFVVN